MNDSAYHFFKDLGRKISEVYISLVIAEKGRSFSSECLSVTSSVLMGPSSSMDL